MRIGIDCRLWDETGVGRYIRNLVEQLKILDKRNNYTLFVLPKDKEGIRYKVSSTKRGNWKVVVADIRWHTIEEQLKFPMILKKENLNLMHFPYFSVPIFYNRPFIVTIHDLILHHFPTGAASTLPLFFYKLKLLGYKFVISKAVQKAKRIIAVSNSTKEEIIDHLGVSPQRVAVTYEGVDVKIRNSNIEIRNNALNTKYKILNTKYFLYVGNAYPHKNLERLLKAFTLFCHPDPPAGGEVSRNSSSRQVGTQNDIRLILVGKEDHFYKRLKEKVWKMKLTDKIIFLQNVSDEELASLYKNAIALVVPSLMEGFGLPALEAMANKCLILASDIPSLRETCGNAALYFNPLSVDELANKLNMITFHTTEYGSLEELRKRGVARAKLFSWEKMAQQTLAVYEQTASNP